jgi:hypothetical protein
MPLRKAQIRHVSTSRGDAVAIKTPYSQMFVEALKQEIPHGHRWWDPALRVWFVSQSCGIQLSRLFTALSVDAEVNDNLVPELGPAGSPPPAAGPAPPPASEDARFYARKYATEDDWRILHLLPSAPFPVAQAAYRALLRMVHPDQGGDGAAAQRVNVAWARVEASLKEES